MKKWGRKSPKRKNKNNKIKEKQEETRGG